MIRIVVDQQFSDLIFGLCVSQYQNGKRHEITGMNIFRIEYPDNNVNFLLETTMSLLNVMDAIDTYFEIVNIKFPSFNDFKMALGE